MIYVTGDRHGYPQSMGEEALPGQIAWTDRDVLLIAGDFGFVFDGEQAGTGETQVLDELAKRPYTIAFVDGNHENFDALVGYPMAQRYGGPVRLIRPNIYWLQRGYVYTIQGKTFFTMGGAYSMDKDYRMAVLRATGRKCWFYQELPTDEEYRRAAKSLEDAGYRVDYVLTHTAPASIIPRVIHRYPDPHDAELTGFLDWVYHEVQFTRWYFGHLHEDMVVNDQMVCCYEAVHTLEETKRTKDD